MKRDNFYLKSLIFITPFAFYTCAGEKDHRPNILIAIGDDISYPHMSAYGCRFVNTPGFDRVAREGILFNNAYTPNAKSSPSRACLLTGRNSWQLEEACNHVPFFPSKFRTFMESLGSHGYCVGYTAKGWAPGVAFDSAGKSRQLTGKPFNSRKIVPPASGIAASDYSGNFEDFLNAREEGKPFCFWYGSQEPHRRYEYGSGLAKGGKKLTDIMEIFGFWPDNDTVRNDMLDYAFEIEYFDSHLVKMLDILESKGELENTLILVTADNGMPFPRIKGQVYEYSNHMPLAMMWAKGIKKPGRVIDDYISFIDLAPTLLEIAGISESESGMQKIEGRSITDIFRSEKNGIINKNRDHVLVGKERHDVGRPGDHGYPVRGIVMDGYLYLKNFKPERWPAGNPETGYMNTDASPVKTSILNMKRKSISDYFWDLNFGKRPEEELYDIKTDPDCIINLSIKEEFKNTLQSLKNKLEGDLLRQADPRMTGNGDIFDNYVYAEERNRNFYNRYMKGELSARHAGWVDSTDFERK